MSPQILQLLDCCWHWCSSWQQRLLPVRLSTSVVRRDFLWTFECWSDWADIWSIGIPVSCHYDSRHWCRSSVRPGWDGTNLLKEEGHVIRSRVSWLSRGWEAVNCWCPDQHDGRSKWRIQFGLFQDDQQIWRCGGWLHNANLSFLPKHPVILPKHALSALISP